MNKIFDKLVKQEQQFKNSEFVAPIFSNKVAVNISGIISTYQVNPKNYIGWAILVPEGFKKVRVVSEPSRHLRNEYLKVLPKFNFVICDIEKRLGIVSNVDQRISTTQPLPFYLAENVGLFDNITVRFDGANFIFDRRLRPVCPNLNSEINKNTKPENLNLPKGLRESYEYVYYKKQKELLGNKEYQVKSAIEKAGGNYISFTDLNNKETRVSFDVNGQTVSATINNDLSVVCAGFCLSGDDTKFDLQSLVSTAIEGQNRPGNLTMGDYRAHYGRI